MLDQLEAYEYRDSGIEQLGNIPAHWDAMSLSRLIPGDRRLTYGIVQPGQRDETGRYMVRGQDYSFGWAEPNTLFRVSDAVEAPYKRSRLRSGDLVITIVGAGVGNVAVIPDWLDNANITQTTARIAVDKSKADPSFVRSVLEGPIGQQSVAIYAKGAAQPGLNLEHVKLFPIPVPPLPEQKQIALFLDYETSKIDALISKQQQLIALLGEKRQAVISHAVTKGLNPDAPMRDSGIQWLGDVPEHWVTTKIGYECAKIGSGKTPKGGADVYQYDGVMLLRSQNVYDTGLRIKDVAFISEQIDREMSNSRVMPYDILLNITGASLGRTCMVPAGLPAANVNQHVCILRLKNKELCDFLSLFLKGSMMKAQYDLSQNGAAREGLNFEEISRLCLAYPPTQEERNEIGTWLDTKSGKLVEAIQAATEMVELLQERRTALISAAVTGKIDVRGWKPPSSLGGQETEMEVA